MRHCLSYNAASVVYILLKTNHSSSVEAGDRLPHLTTGLKKQFTHLRESGVYENTINDPRLFPSRFLNSSLDKFVYSKLGLHIMHEFRQSLQQVLLVSTSLSLFEESLVHVLTKIGGMQVSSFEYTNALCFRNAVLQAQPDVILVSEFSSLNTTHLVEILLEASPSLKANTRIVVTRLANNLIDVYELPRQADKKFAHQQYTISQRDEFVAIVQGNIFARKHYSSILA